MNITNMETNNMNIRERFEEIWPVPEGVYWNPDVMLYVARHYTRNDAAYCYCERLDTFTRCQETNQMVGVLVDDLIRELDNAKSFITDGYTRARITCTIENAKQIMEQKK